MTKAFFKSRNI